MTPDQLKKAIYSEVPDAKVNIVDMPRWKGRQVYITRPVSKWGRNNTCTSFLFFKNDRTDFDVMIDDLIRLSNYQKDCGFYDHDVCD